MITDADETAYREEVRNLVVWCQDSNLFLNISKNKELIMDYRRKRLEHDPIQIDGAVVEWVESFMFLVVLNMVHTHLHSHKEGTTAPLPSQKAEKRHHGGRAPCHPGPLY